MIGAKMKMNGKKIESQTNTTEICHSSSLDELFGKQMSYQYKVLRLRKDSNQSLPQDSTKWFSYHIQAMVEEMGEVMKADKRWKTHRNERFEPSEKLDEIADLFITVMNIAMYSGINGQTLSKAVCDKIKQNAKDLE